MPRKPVRFDERAIKNREYYANNKEKHKAAVVRWRTKNKEKHCQYTRNHQLKSQYGITQTDYDRMLVEQNGVCKVCRKRGEPEGGSLAVDHCHATGKVRGLLCQWCNRAIGLMGDDALIVRAAADYLEKQS